MKYLVVGLGNPGYEYDGTRHNIGFRVVDALASAAGAVWEDKRYGFVAQMRVKNAQIVLLKPTTFMNLSGNAVRYWLEKENIPIENLLVIVDDLSLPVGTLRLRAKGSDGGHNGLKHIAQLIGQGYARLKFGIGNAVRYWLEKENIPTENLLVIVDDLSLPVGTLRLRAKGSDGGHNGLKHIAQLIGQGYARLKFGIGNDFPRGAQADFVLGKFSTEDEALIEKQLPTACDIVKSFCLAGITITMNQYNKKN